MQFSLVDAFDPRRASCSGLRSETSEGRVLGVLLKDAYREAVDMVVLLQLSKCEGTSSPTVAADIVIHLLVNY